MAQHYLWAGGHFLLLLSALRYLLAYVMWKTISPWWYKGGWLYSAQSSCGAVELVFMSSAASFLGALVSYAIVCYKSLGAPQPNGAYVKKALADENVQYLFLAFFWWSSKPVPVALFPFFIFSLFHALTFTRTTLMPRFLPPAPPTTAGGSLQPHPLARRLQTWVKNNYDAAMRIVAYSELVIFVRVLFGAILFRNSLLAPLVYAHFLRQRYYQSAFTRDAVAVADARINDLVHRVDHPVLNDVWSKAKELIGRWAAAPMQPAGGAARDQ
ncbi:hypothetical protein ID866_1359 [Astraeus odoratus]|nr:hypothetical protein ID866_1359 [Astraeus odoratus]